MNIAEFKQAVASFVGRDPTYFQDNVDGTLGPDKLLIAINNAKIFLQRQIDFEYARKFVDYTYHTSKGAQDGINMETAVEHDTACPIAVKKIINLFTPHGFERLLPLRQKTFRGVSDMVRGSYERHEGQWIPELRPVYGNMAPLYFDKSWTAVWGHTHRDPIYYQHGRTILMYPKPGNHDQCQTSPPPDWALPFIADVVAFLPLYQNDNPGADTVTDIDGRGVPYVSDFLLTDCYDYMLWWSIAELNVFLKDDDQVGVSQSKMTEALENIRQWNADIINAGYDIE